MLFLYIFLILLAAFPLLMTARRMKRASYIKKNGIHVNGNITHINTIRIKNSRIDSLTFEYQDRVSRRVYSGKATAQEGKYRYADPIPVAYLPDDPAKYAVVNAKGGYTAVLIFCILLFLFVLFAVYKIDEMVRNGSM